MSSKVSRWYNCPLNSRQLVFEDGEGGKLSKKNTGSDFGDKSMLYVLGGHTLGGERNCAGRGG